MCIFLLQLPVPSMIQSSMGAIARLNAPIAMIILGVYLGHVPIREILCDKNAWKCSAVLPDGDTLATPLLCFGSYFLIIRPMAMALLASAIARWDPMWRYMPKRELRITGMRLKSYA